MKSRVSRGPATASAIIDGGLGLRSPKAAAGPGDAAAGTVIIRNSVSPVPTAQGLSFLRRLIARIDLKDFPGSCCG